MKKAIGVDGATDLRRGSLPSVVHRHRYSFRQASSPLFRSVASRAEVDISHGNYSLEDGWMRKGDLSQNDRYFDW